MTHITPIAAEPTQTVEQVEGKVPQARPLSFEEMDIVSGGEAMPNFQ